MIAFLVIIEDEVTRNKLEEIYNLFNKDLFYVAYDILKDYHEAEDVVQSAIIKISEHLEKITDIKCNKTKGYIVAIVRNLAINIYNQRMRKTTISIEEIDIIDELETNPEQKIIRIDDGEWIAGQLALIKPEYADILVLRYTYEYSNKEIAKLLGITEVNVRVRLQRAKKALHYIIGGGKAHEQAK